MASNHWHVGLGRRPEHEARTVRVYHGNEYGMPRPDVAEGATMAEQNIVEKSLTVGTDQLIDVAHHTAKAAIAALGGTADVVEQAGHGAINIAGASKDAALQEIVDIQDLLEEKIRAFRDAVVAIVPGGV